MEYAKLQIGCMLIIIYIAFAYYRDIKRFKQKHKITLFDIFLIVGMICILFDGASAYTVNHLEEVSPLVNKIFHLGFLLSLDATIFLVFLYMISITHGLPKRRSRLWVLCTPFIINVIIVIVNISSLEYRYGDVSNYSMGVSAYTCFAMVGLYVIAILAYFLKNWKFIENHRRTSILTYLLLMAGVAIYQMVYPESLITSLCVTILIIGIYINQENPSLEELSHYYSEMIMGFATLVESKDGSTGGHIKRTTMYTKLLAEELRRQGYYKKILNKDYMRRLKRSSPMHDIGKIAVPDVILQKPGKLTSEEFDQIKLHTIKGGEIINDTFGHLDDEQYTLMAYQVARYHHEKWNGKGYPEGLKETQIPLCARIMAVADVFDAVSEKRCYRDAMPLDKCFDIIKEGKGTDFDPIIVEAFLNIREKIEAAHDKAQNDDKN